MTRNNSIQVFRGGWKELEDSVFTNNIESVIPNTSMDSCVSTPDGTLLLILDGNIVKTLSYGIPHDAGTINPTPIREFIIQLSDAASPRGISFEAGVNQGKRMIIADDDAKTLISYTVPVAYDTDSIDENETLASVSISEITGELFNHKWSTEGNFIFITSNLPTRVHKFTFTTNWDITTKSASESIDPGLVSIAGIEIKPEGDKVYIIDTDAHKLVEFGMSPSYDLPSLATNGNELDFLSDEFVDLKYRSNGKEVTFLEASSDNVIRYHVDKAWNISTASHFTNEFDLGGGINFAVTWEPGGMTFFTINGLGAGRAIEQWAVPNRYNQTGAVLVGSFSLVLFPNNIQCMYIRKNGLECYIITVASNVMFQLDMGMQWDINTMFDSGVEKDLSGIVSQAAGLYMRDDGLKIFVSDQGNSNLHELNMDEWDITTLVLVQSVLIAVMDQLSGIFFKQDGRLLYLLDRRNVNLIMMFRVDTPWNISVILLIASKDIDAQESNVRGLFIRESDGKKIYFIGTGSGTVYSIDVSLEFNNTIITNFGDDLITNTGDRLVYA